MAAPALSQELQALFDANDVPETLREFLAKHKVLSVKEFACTSPTEEAIDKRLIEATGLDFNFGERIRIVTAWHAARAALNAPASNKAVSDTSFAVSSKASGAKIVLNVMGVILSRR